MRTYTFRSQEWAKNFFSHWRCTLQTTHATLYGISNSIKFTNSDHTKLFILFSSTNCFMFTLPSSFNSCRETFRKSDGVCVKWWHFQFEMDGAWEKSVWERDENGEIVKCSFKWIKKIKPCIIQFDSIYNIDGMGTKSRKIRSNLSHDSTSNAHFNIVNMYVRVERWDEQ